MFPAAGAARPRRSADALIKAWPQPAGHRTHRRGSIRAGRGRQSGVDALEGRYRDQRVGGGGRRGGVLPQRARSSYDLTPKFSNSSPVLAQFMLTGAPRLLPDVLRRDGVGAAPARDSRRGFRSASPPVFAAAMSARPTWSPIATPTRGSRCSSPASGGSHSIRRPGRHLPDGASSFQPHVHGRASRITPPPAPMGARSVPRAA